ncbi:MAG: glycoside hydrolase family 130 protein [Ignavibacteriales bacterium]|nr:glycoside hydrolase family 130 protein [Ignavibacteriales bacterium]MBK7981577.1 glycoside hydrolase family 130 protein [Ignavibacteriota bacterium]
MVSRSNIKLKANSEKVVLQYFDIGEVRSKKLIERILSLDKSITEKILIKVFADFGKRHRLFEELLMANYKKAKKNIAEKQRLTNDQKLLIGSYFSKEYSIEAAALFNPSIVVHPNQTKSSKDELNFIISLRAAGEGHISSIEFREGKIKKENKIDLVNKSRFASLPQKYVFAQEKEIDKRRLGNTLSNEERTDFLLTNYTAEFNPKVPLEERVLFPKSSSENIGMEDLRLVKFTDKGITKYYGTYTAYNGKSFRPQLLETEDFRKFKVSSLYGNAVYDKGFALFPRKINNKFVFTSRQDGENLYMMYSDNLYKWESKEIIRMPQNYWEFVQLGNCGSPLETEKGWLLIIHAVGPFRTYVISALLLDLNNPAKVIGALDEPLIQPNKIEREGYVPNVVYSCGSIIHKNNLVIPYAMSDSATGFTFADVNKILNKINFSL